MSIRETLNQHRKLGAVAGALLLVVAGALIVWANASTVPGSLKRIYYSDDDGKTYFADDSTRICPFDHNGKSACRASVYQCTDGTRFVAYLERYTDAAKAKLNALSGSPNDPANAAVIDEVQNTGIEVKKPGDKTWVSLNSSQGMALVVPKCPNGGVPHDVYP